MSRKENFLDNTLIENFFGLMKQEMDHHRSFSHFEEPKLAVKIAINYYNQH